MCTRICTLGGTFQQDLEDEGLSLTEQEIKYIPLITPAHILMFASGAANVPSVGFHPTPTIVIMHDEQKNIPCAQTCSNMLYLYVNKHTKEHSLAHYVLTALMNGGVFSKMLKI